jgi:hypothetical protein
VQFSGFATSGIKYPRALSLSEAKKTFFGQKLIQISQPLQRLSFISISALFLLTFAFSDKYNLEETRGLKPAACLLPTACF